MQKSGFIACVVVLLCAGAFLLYGLGNDPLQDYDEATYAEVVHEALESGSLLSYAEGGAPFLEKPPLGFLAMEASISLFGESTFALRLPFALFGIASILALMLLVYEVRRSMWAAALAGGILATMPPFMEASRQVRLDIPLVFFTTLAVYFFVRGLKNPKWFIAFGAATGLAVMSKSVVAVFALVAAAGLVVLYRRFDVFLNKYLYWGGAAFVTVAAPWHVWEWMQFGSVFWSRYIGFNVIDRTQENLFWTVQITNADYVWYLQQFARPWFQVFCIAVAAIAMGWKWIPQEPRRFVGVCIVATASVLGIFFIAKTKAPTYLLPMYPFIAAAIALIVMSVKQRLLQVAAGVLCVLLLISAAHTTYTYAYHLDPYFKVVMDMSKDEEQIGTILRTVPLSVPVYVFDFPNLGSIAYHSRHLSIGKLTATSTSSTKGYVIAASKSLGLFGATYKTVTAKVLYQGPEVTLLQIE
jgi:4-amino-4-deoxy-L-arabinose transferase-like glycosyltransferase